MWKSAVRYPGPSDQKPETLRAGSWKVERLPCTVIRKGLCSLLEYCVLNFTFDQPSHRILLVKPEWENQEAPKSQCFQTGEYLCTWVSLWFFLTEAECCARSGRPSLTSERNVPDTEFLHHFSAEGERFPFTTEQACCQDCCTLIQYLFTKVKNTAASWLLLLL